MCLELLMFRNPVQRQEIVEKPSNQSGRLGVEGSNPFAPTKSFKGVKGSCGILTNPSAAFSHQLSRERAEQ